MTWLYSKGDRVRWTPPSSSPKQSEGEIVDLIPAGFSATEDLLKDGLRGSSVVSQVDRYAVRCVMGKKTVVKFPTRWWLEKAATKL
jgi:hypothetical protein